ncbi:MAG TPA: hybrid sensor histidine kinase/response regulator [Candidatus Binatia bacterium]|nr:hybrid sensor histidine kinase/response regulator [Candidatus Binatia bacterium]
MARRSARPDSQYTILVVDDHEETLQSARVLLGREGHRVLTASSGEQALLMLKGVEVQVIIVDYMMPRMDGAELVREVRKSDPLVQIILQTGYAGDRPPRATLAELDIQGYHDKADDPERLLVWVDVAIKAHALLKKTYDRERAHAELVANCSHELRTPLNVITGWADLMIEGELGQLPEEAERSMRSISRAARSLCGVVADYLEHAKLDAGMHEVVREPVDLSELVAETSQLAGLLLEGRNVAFATRVEPLPGRLVTDGVKLQTIVRNLVTNAVKFTSQGRIELIVRSRPEAVVIEVCDTGCGIRAEDREIIFEPFRQLHAHTKQSHGGIGLGLALSRRLARMLGGDVSVESEPGRGSRFRLTLPIADSPPRERLVAATADAA